MSEEKSNSRDPVCKALRLLRLLMEEPARSWGVRETALAMEISPSSAHRLLSALATNGFATRSAEGSFSLSLDAIRLSNLVVARVPAQDIALRHLRVLARECNEAVFFGTYDHQRQEIFFNTHISSTQNLRYVVETNQWVPIYSGASGLAVMAFLPKEERESIVARSGLAPLTDKTLTDPEALEAFLAEIRQKGYAFTRGQRISGAVGVAAPVFGADGNVVGAVSISLPEQRFVPGDEEKLAKSAMRCGCNITQELGGSTAAQVPAGQVETISSSGT